ncbi:MAG TPA: hypothetical protein VI298_09670 [Geobacteraceae bacterium]
MDCLSAKLCVLCGEHDITADVEVIPIHKVNEALFLAIDGKLHLM